jgi:hypothetical protein
MTGFTKEVEGTDTGANGGLAIFTKDAAGSDTVTLTSPSGLTLGYTFRIRNAEPVSEWSFSGGAFASTQMNAVSHVHPGGARPLLWVAAAGFIGTTGSVRFTGFPSGWERRLIYYPQSNATSRVGLVVAFRVTTGTDTMATATWAHSNNRSGYGSICAIPLRGS